MTRTPLSALRAALRSEPSLSGWRLAAILRDRPPVLVAKLLGPGGAQRAAKIWSPHGQAHARAAAERLTRAAAALEGSAHQAVRVEALLPAHGLLITAWRDGTALAQMLAGTGRTYGLAAAAGWLAALSRRRENGAFAPQWWLSRLDQRRDAQGADAPLRARLATMVPGLRSAPFTRALTHGDFTPDNLSLTPAGAVTAIDLTAGQGPVARDLARMRAWLGSRDGARFWLADRAALTPPGLLPDSETPVLSFLTGIMLIDYLAAAAHRPDRRAALIEAGAAWLDETA